MTDINKPTSRLLDIQDELLKVRHLVRTMRVMGQTGTLDNEDCASLETIAIMAGDAMLAVHDQITDLCKTL